MIPDPVNSTLLLLLALNITVPCPNVTVTEINQELIFQAPGPFWVQTEEQYWRGNNSLQLDTEQIETGFKAGFADCPPNITKKQHHWKALLETLPQKVKNQAKGLLIAGGILFSSVAFIKQAIKHTHRSRRQTKDKDI